VRRLLTVLCGLTALSCAGVHRIDRIPPGDGPVVGLYKAAIDDGSGVLRRAKLSLWAERPDRLHAELMGPVGGVSFTLDAGGGRVCLVDVGSAAAYAGDDGTDAMEALVGVRATVAEAVAALLTGAPPAGLSVERFAPSEGALPDTFRIADGERSLALARIGFSRGATDPRRIGTGAPPPNMSALPLTELKRRADGDR